MFAEDAIADCKAGSRSLLYLLENKGVSNRWLFPPGCSRQRKWRVPAKSTTGSSPRTKVGEFPCDQRGIRSNSRYSTLYSILIPRRAISSRKESAGMSRSCKTAPRLLTAPVHIICRTIEAGKAVVRIMALMSLLES